MLYRRHVGPALFQSTPCQVCLTCPRANAKAKRNLSTVAEAAIMNQGMEWLLATPKGHFMLKRALRKALRPNCMTALHKPSVFNAECAVQM